MGYTSDILRGFSWMTAFRVVTRFFAFIRIAILARLLTPFQFGVFGVASLVLSFFETISQLGTPIFLIQEKKKLDEYINAAYIISIARGVLIAFVIFCLSRFFSDYFNSPESVTLVRLVSLVALIRGFINPSRVKFVKHLKFNHEFFFSLAIFLIDSTISVILAFITKSPISMVWGLVFGAILEVLLSHLLISPRPKIIVEKEKLKLMLSRGKWITGSTIFSYLFEQGDDLFVGKFLNTTALGIYQAAYKIATLPLTEVVKVINQVTFPVYTNISGEKVRLRNAFLRTSVSILIIIIPIGILLYIYPLEITLLILGDKWIEVAPVVKLLSVFGVIRAFVVSVNPLFNSIKRQDVVAKISFVGTSVMFIAIVFLINSLGLIGVTYSVLLGSLATLPFIYYYFGKLLI